MAPRKFKRKKIELLFDYVLVVKLVDAKNKKDPPTARLDYRFPPIFDKMTATESSMIENITSFCFPDIASPKVRKKRKSRQKTFRFVLTELDGSKRFGYCMRLLPKGSKKKQYSECFCLVSFLPCWSLFEPILRLVEEKRATYNRQAVFLLLKSIMAQPFPDPGSAIEVPLISPTGGDMEQHTFIRPPDSDNQLVFLDAKSLLRSLSPKTLLIVFASLVKERPILFTSKDVDILSNCVQAIVSLLYPFVWQGALIPVLPEAMLDFCGAPVPYLLGVLDIMVPDLYRMVGEGAMEQVMLLDLDKDKFIWEGDGPADWESIPSLEANRLLKSLTDFKKTYKPLFKENNKNPFPSEHLHIPFINFFTAFIGNYQKAFTITEDERLFDINKFLEVPCPGFQNLPLEKAYPKFSKEFVTNTQMFGMFCSEREQHQDRFSGPFEQRLQQLGLQDARAMAPLAKESRGTEPPPVKKPTGPTRPCAFCRGAIGLKAKFCLHCGKKQPTGPKEEKETCPKCKIYFKATAKFCVGCGYKRSDADPPARKSSTMPSKRKPSVKPVEPEKQEFEIPKKSSLKPASRREKSTSRSSSTSSLSRTQSTSMSSPTSRKKGDKKVCSTCGVDQMPGKKFCADCGAKYNIIVAIVEEVASCSGCGTPSTGKKFCTSCGQPYS